MAVFGEKTVDHLTTVVGEGTRQGYLGDQGRALRAGKTVGRDRFAGVVRERDRGEGRRRRRGRGGREPRNPVHQKNVVKPLASRESTATIRLTTPRVINAPGRSGVASAAT